MSGIGSNNGWMEAAIAWEVCASLHRQYCKGKDALFTTRQSDFVKHAENAREHISHGQAPAQQPAPSAAPAEQQMVAYLDIGAGGYIDLGSELTDEALLRLPKGRHALVIAGTFGIDGYVSAKPSPTPQADSVLEDAVEQYLEAQDALDNRDYSGINAESYEKLVRQRNAARRDLEAARAQQKAGE